MTSCSQGRGAVILCRQYTYCSTIKCDTRAGYCSIQFRSVNPLYCFVRQKMKDERNHLETFSKIMKAWQIGVKICRCEILKSLDERSVLIYR